MSIEIIDTEDLDTLGTGEDGVLLADGFEDAFVGIVFRFGAEPIACYDYNRCLQILVGRDGMTELEADEYFSYNVIGAWVGEQTPCFVAGAQLDAIHRHYAEYNA